jgi:1,2-diacylglycerol 3-alpha-glucosyltransferase
MNIGLVTTWFPSGAGFVSKAYERALSHKNNIFIFARGCKPQVDSEWNGKNVTWASVHPCITGVYSKEFKKWIETNNISTVLFNEQRHWEIIKFAKGMNLIVGAYIDYYTADTVPFFNLYDFLICNTKRHFKVFKNHPQVVYCPWGTNIKEYTPSKSLASRPLTFLISAGWDGAYAKDADWLDRRGAGLTLRAFSKLKGECKLIVLSQVELESCPLDWSEIVNSDSRIKFMVGSFSPTPYNLGDIYVYPSRLDGIGLTLPEAISSGLPAITTNSPPMTEFVIDEFNGKLIQVEDFRGRPDGYFWAESICSEKSLIDAMSYYINNQDQILIHSSNSREFAIENLDWEKNSAFLIDWFSNLVRINKVEMNKINGVNLGQVLRYDRNNNPTPLQRILVGLKRILVK